MNVGFKLYREVRDYAPQDQPTLTYLCACGHLAEDHAPACTCRCPAYSPGEQLLDCGHVPDDDPCQRLPRMIVAPTLNRKRGKLPFRRVWDRDGWRCVRCGTHKSLTVDHIVPVSKGGTDDIANLQTMCGPCNSSKGARA